MGFSLVESGSLENFKRSLSNLRHADKAVRKKFESYGQQGVNALSAATPVQTGLAANSWDYFVRHDKSGVTLVWTNSDIESGFPVVIALQYGYATGTGGYVAGRDYINPALKPIFDKISADLAKEVSA